MRPRLSWLTAAVIVVGAAAWVYVQYFSTPAQIKAASMGFMRTAVSGDEAAIAEYLTPDSPMTTTDVARLYKGHTYNNFHVYPLKAISNHSGVTWLANTSILDPASPGYTKGVTLAYKRVDGRWLIYKAGGGFSL